MKAVALALLSAFLASGVLAPEAAAAVEATLEFPGASWADIPPDTLSNACKAGLASVRHDLESLSTTSLIAVYRGRVLMGHGPVEAPIYVASERKSILAILFGKYVASGAIDLDRTIADIGIDEPDGLLPVERGARLRDLISARSGVYHPASNPGDNTAFAPPRGSVKPGTYFLYNNWDFNAAGGAFELLTKQSIYTAFAEDLAKPLQLQDFDATIHRLDGDASRSRYLAYPFSMSARDMARIGHLMLAHGRWRDRQVVPRDWMTQLVRPTTRSTEMRNAMSYGLGYGYMWWLLEEPKSSVLAGAYAAMGAWGQYLLVIPKRQMVIAHNVKVGEDPPYPPEVRWPRFLDVARKLAQGPCLAAR
jgi:CubicO group peptidase (beta-lactamase class C family)